MIEVIGRDENLAKRKSCYNCGSVLKYMPVDVKRDFTSDYTGSKDYYNYIPCPSCGKHVTV